MTELHCPPPQKKKILILQKSITLQHLTQSLLVFKYLSSHGIMSVVTPHDKCTHEQVNMHTNHLTCFQNSRDFLQNMINTQTPSGPKNETQIKGNYTVMLHTYKSTHLCSHVFTPKVSDTFWIFSLFVHPALPNRSHWSWDHLTSNHACVRWLWDERLHPRFIGLQFGEKPWSDATLARGDRLHFP